MKGEQRSQSRASKTSVSRGDIGKIRRALGSEEIVMPD